MNSFFKKVKIYYYFWIVSVLILMIGFSRSEETSDINIHDTYFVIASLHLAYLLSFSYFLLGLGYYLVEKVFKRNLVKSLSIIHSLILIGSFIIYWLMLFYYQLKPKNEIFPLLDDGSYTMNSMIIYNSLLIIFVAQPIYVINIVIAFFRKRKAFS
jgi:heme/copper-type cytochrome/quinol oxidase subunit 1